MTKWKGVRNICYKHCRQFMLTASEWMKHNQNTIAVINHRAIWIKFCDHSWPFCQLVKKNWPLSRGYFGSWGHSLVAVAAVERWPLLRGLNKSQCMNNPPQKSGRCREVAVVEGFKQEPMYEQSTPKSGCCREVQLLAEVCLLHISPVMALFCLQYELFSHSFSSVLLWHVHICLFSESLGNKK